jgi:Flp pilus assembly protein TadG
METAAVLPALVVVLAAALWMVAVVNARLECVDAARAAARAAARGESQERVRRVAAEAAPRGARVVIDRREGVTQVEVTADVRPGWGSRFPAITVHATATSLNEPDLLW